MFKFIKYIIINHPWTLFFVLAVFVLIVFIYTQTNTNSNNYSLISSGKGGYMSFATVIIGFVALYIFILIGFIDKGVSKLKKYFEQFSKKGKKKRK